MFNYKMNTNSSTLKVAQVGTTDSGIVKELLAGIRGSRNGTLGVWHEMQVALYRVGFLGNLVFAINGEGGDEYDVIISNIVGLDTPCADPINPKAPVDPTDAPPSGGDDGPGKPSSLVVGTIVIVCLVVAAGIAYVAYKYAKQRGYVSKF